MRDQQTFDIRGHVPGPAGFLGAAANVVMQLGWREVGYGVLESKVDSGNVMIHPWKRLRTTITYLVVALFGTEEDRARYREAVNRSHVPVKSGPDSPVTYNAFDPELQLWVAACLYIGVRDMRTTFLGPLSDSDADALYQYCSRLGTSLQVRQDQWPADLEAFDKYWREGVQRVRYDAPVREHLMKVVELRMVPAWMSWPNRALNRWATTAFLPPEFRQAMGLSWTAKDQRRWQRFCAVVRVGSRLLPRWVRMLPIQLQLAEFRLRARRGWRLT
ncbi:oxygenase MpaB family protein [Nocardioides stalactiti]|uniref:oxygenase MpaB family protein n=1 Tax=Nocardioides stalactiti TaxID=2755356 RepID=UPI001C7EC4BD|nr:oxygenase MpaB family protein [Nocardioides stalactiti]